MTRKTLEKNASVNKTITERISTSSHPVFLTGGAGTGKTTSIQDLIDSGKLGEVALLSSTGMSAQKIGGRTLHAYEKLGLLKKPIEVADHDTLIIDEISMVTSELVDRFERRLRDNCDIDEPFGGKRLIAVGDMYQLPPVVDGKLKTLIKRQEYTSQYFYDAKVFRELELCKVELSSVHRQSDPEFVKHLNWLRLGLNRDKVVTYFNQGACRRRFDVNPVILCSRNADVAEHNMSCLGDLCGGAKKYPIKGSSLPPADFTQHPITPRFKVGARVMTTVNNTNAGYQNGSLGFAEKLGNGFVDVRFDQSGLLRRVSYQKEVWMDDKGTEHAYRYLPLQLAWALTIHKVQGQTFDAVMFDNSSGFFAPGHFYVGSSRVRTFRGLQLDQPIRRQDIWVDPRHGQFLPGLKSL